jgi:hypothetical protein
MTSRFMAPRDLVHRIIFRVMVSSSRTPASTHRQAIAGVVCLALVFATWPSVAQTPPRPAPVTSKADRMAAAFRAGTLPPPAPLPAGTLDQQAAALARAIAAGDDNSTPALLTALLAAGYIIRNGDGTQTKTTGGQGMALADWEVAAMAKEFGRGQSTPLTRIAEGLQRFFPPFRQMPLDDYLVAGIRDGAASDRPARRFWARLIVELGKRGPEPYDLLQVSTTPAEVELDAIQRVLVLMRLAGDMATLEPRRPDAGRGRGPAVALRPASLLRPALGSAGLAQAGDAGPCATDSRSSVILDYSALGLSTGATKVLEALKSNYDKVEGYLDKASVANVLLNILKFVLSYAAIDVQLAIDGPILTRTKTTTPGEQRTVTATAKIDMNKWAQLTNCVRPALNMAGLDFSLPANGAMSNVKVTWVLIEDETKGGIQSVMHNANLEEKWGTGNLQDSMPVGGVFLKGRRSADQVTDAKGQTSILVVGAPQSEDLTRQVVTRQERVVRVAAFIQAKSTDLQTLMQDAWQSLSTVGDYLGPLVAYIGGDKIGASVGATAETLYRSTWYSSDEFPFTVRDWQPCNDQWSGRITAMTTGKSVDHRQVYDFGTETSTTRTRIRLNANMTAGSGQEVVDYNQSSVANLVGSEFCSRNAHPPDAPYYGRTTSETTGTGAGPAALSVTTNSANQTYTIAVAPDFEYDVAVRERKQVFQGCPSPRPPEPERRLSSKSRAAIRIFDVPTDKATPGVLIGTRTDTLMDGSTVVYTWDLRRCK